MPLYFPPDGITGILINGTTFSGGAGRLLSMQNGDRLSICETPTNVMYFDDSKLLQRIYMSTLGNTSGQTGFAINQLVFVGGSNVTLEGSWSEANTSAAYSKASGTITIHAGAFKAGISTGGNTAGTSGTNTGQLLLYGGSNITLSQSTGTGGNTVTIVGASGGTGGGVQATIPCVWLGNIMDATADALKNGSYWVQSTMIPGYMELAKIGVGLLGANNSSQFTLSMSLRFQLFTKNGSTLSPFTSASTLITQVMYDSTNANFSLISGMRFAECPLSYTFSTGGAIYIGMNISTTRSGANLSPRILMVIGPNYSNFGWRFGEAGAHLIFPGYGTYSVTTNGTLASIAITAIGFQTSANTWRSQPLIYLTNSEGWP